MNHDCPACCPAYGACDRYGSPDPGERAFWFAAGVMLATLVNLLFNALIIDALLK
jgi:hypothetical protein